MAALAHLGVGLAAKKIQPRIPLGVLLILAWVIDILWTMFFLTGVEHLPTQSETASAPWSHSLFMAVIWSVIASLTAVYFTKNIRIILFTGLLVFSHWLIDFITHPMTAAYPNDTGLPIFFNGTNSLGLGLYSTNIGTNIGEYGTLIAGIIIYIFALVKIRKEKKISASE